MEVTRAKGTVVIVGDVGLKVERDVFYRKEIDLRVSVLPCAPGEKIVMRILDSSGLRVNITDLGFEPEANEIFQRCSEVHIRSRSIHTRRHRQRSRVCGRAFFPSNALDRRSVRE